MSKNEARPYRQISSTLKHLNKTSYDLIKVYYQNVRGSKTKFRKSTVSTETVEYDVLMFTETWLHSGIFDLELGLHNFNIYGFDRSIMTSD